MAKRGRSDGQAAPVSVEAALGVVVAHARASAALEGGRAKVRLHEGFPQGVLAEDVVASVSLPYKKTAIRDGYAVRASDGARTRRLVGRAESFAVRQASDEYRRAAEAALGHGEASYVATGAPLPRNADAVVMQEKCDVTPDKLSVTPHAAPKGPGMNLREPGSDFRKGDVLLRRGDAIDAHAVLVGQAAGLSEVAVRRRPRVWIVSTGDELLTPERSNVDDQSAGLGDDGVFDANRAALRYLFTDEGSDVIDGGICADTLAAAVGAVQRAYDDEEASLLVTTGGASVGVRDHVHAAVDAVAARHGGWSFGGCDPVWRFEAVRMKPGKPTGFAALARKNNTRPLLVLCLPGNPASAMTTAHLFAVPCIRALARRVERAVPHVRAAVHLAHQVTLDAERPEYMRAALRGCVSDDAHLGVAEGALVAEVTGNQVSSRPQSMMHAAALLELPPADGDVKALPAGTRVTALLIARPSLTVAGARTNGSVNAGVLAEPKSTAGMRARDLLEKAALSSSYGERFVAVLSIQSQRLPGNDMSNGSQRLELQPARGLCVDAAIKALSANNVLGLRMGERTLASSGAAEALSAEFGQLARAGAAFAVVLGPCAAKTGNVPCSSSALASDAVALACDYEIPLASKAVRQSIRQTAPTAAALSQGGVFVYSSMWVAVLEARADLVEPAIGVIVKLWKQWRASLL